MMLPFGTDELEVKVLQAAIAQSQKLNEWGAAKVVVVEKRRCTTESPTMRAPVMFGAIESEFYLDKFWKLTACHP